MGKLVEQAGTLRRSVVPQVQRAVRFAAIGALVVAAVALVASAVAKAAKLTETGMFATQSVANLAAAGNAGQGENQRHTENLSHVRHFLSA
jgi:hypothetical protein